MKVIAILVLFTTVLVPFNVDSVPEIDLDAGRLTINPPEGLLD